LRGNDCTVIEGVGRRSFDTVSSMSDSMEAYAKTIPGVNVQTTLSKNADGWKAIATVVDSAGEAVVGYSDTIKSNPLKLPFEPGDKLYIVDSMEEINGVWDNVRSNVEAIIKPQVETKATLSDADKLKEDLAGIAEAKDNLGAKTTELQVQVDAEGKAVAELKEIDRLKALLDADAAKIDVDVDPDAKGKLAGIAEAHDTLDGRAAELQIVLKDINDAKTSIGNINILMEKLDENEAELKIKFSNRKINEDLIRISEAKDKLGAEVTKLQVQVEGADEAAKELKGIRALQALLDADAAKIDVDVDPDAEGKLAGIAEKALKLSKIETELEIETAEVVEEVKQEKKEEEKSE